MTRRNRGGGGPPANVSFRQVEMRSGPLPDAAELAKYNQVHPGAAAIIIQMAQDHAAHKRAVELETLALQKQQQDHNLAVISAHQDILKRNQIFAFIIVILALGFAAALIYMGNVGWGLTTFALEMLAVASLFIYSKKSDRASNDKET